MERFAMNSQYGERRMTIIELAMNTDLVNMIMSFLRQKWRRSFSRTCKELDTCYKRQPMYIVYDAECNKNNNWSMLMKRLRYCAGPAYWGPVRWIKLVDFLKDSKPYQPPIKTACLKYSENLIHLKSIPSLTSLMLPALMAPKDLSPKDLSLKDLSPNDLLLQLSALPLLKCLWFHYYDFKECDISQGFLSFKKLEELYLTQCKSVNAIRFSQNLKRFMISGNLYHDIELDASLCHQFTHPEFRCQELRDAPPSFICFTPPKIPTITKIKSNVAIKIKDNNFAAFDKLKKIDFHWIPFGKFCGIKQRVAPDQFLNYLHGPDTMDLVRFIHLERLRLRGLKMKKNYSFHCILPSGNRLLEVEYMTGDPYKLLAIHQIQLSSQNSKVFMGPLNQIPNVQKPTMLTQEPTVVLTPQSYTTPMVTPALQKLLDEANNLHTLTWNYSTNIMVLFNSCNDLQTLLKTCATASELLLKNSSKYSRNYYLGIAQNLEDESEKLKKLLDVHREIAGELFRNVNDVQMLYLSYSKAILVFSQHSTAAQHLPSISHDQLSKNCFEALQKLPRIMEITLSLFIKYSEAVDRSRTISNFNCSHQEFTQAS